MFLTNVKMGSIMASVPMADLQALSTMDDYDKMLAMDRLSKQYGVSVANILVVDSPKFDIIDASKGCRAF